MASEIGHLAERTKILLSRGGTTESGQRSGAISDADLEDAVRKVLARDRIALDTGGLEASAQDLERLVARGVVQRARAALARMDAGTPPGNLADPEVSALEVVVHSVGRPAMRYRGGQVETPTNEVADNSKWYHLVVEQRDEINRLSSRVGRVACGQGSIEPVEGTGWRVGADLIITNHHVLDKLASGQGANGTPALDTAKMPFVDFGYTDDTAGPVSFRITEVVHANRDWDMATLRIEPGNAPLPPPIKIDWDKASLGRMAGAQPVFRGATIYAVGHPYHKRGTAEIAGVFGSGQVDGRKRWAPGLITGIEEALPVFRHDCSTLGGNSGSCIVATNAGTGHVAVGLHFGGRSDPAREGFGSTNFAIAFAHIADHPAAKCLK